MTLAHEEMKAAEMLLDTLPRQSAFFQQQAAEKLLRAVLELDGIPAGPTHNLRTLTDLLAPLHMMKPEFLAIEEWSAAATRFRYPSGSGAVPNAPAGTLKARQATLDSLEKTVAAFISAHQSP